MRGRGKVREAVRSVIRRRKWMERETERGAVEDGVERSLMVCRSIRKRDGGRKDESPSLR